MGDRSRSPPRREIPQAIPVDCYIADFASVEVKLIVEVDGLSHDVADQAAYDAERDAALAVLGWRVLRIRDALILSAPHEAAELIRKALL